MNNKLNKNIMSINKLKHYVIENRNIIVIGIFILLTIYGRSLYVLNARIDTEVLINNPNSPYNWLEIGRQGGVFTRLLIEQLNFNPYFATLLSFIILIISMIILGYFFNYIGGVKTALSTGIFLIFLVHPIWIEQFYFTMMVLEISVAVFLTIIAVFVSISGILNDNIWLKILSIILMIWAFSTYQLFMVLYISISVFSFILMYRNSLEFENEEQVNSSVFFKMIFQLILIFLCAVIINTVITKVFFSNGSSYLTNQIRWGIDPATQCIRNIIKHITEVVFGKGIFYSYSYIISSILMLVSLVYSLKHKKNAKLKWLYILSGIGLQICPFLITIYGGTIPVYRAQFVLPFITACNLGFSIIAFSYTKKIKIFIEIICFVIFIMQMQSVMRMQYTDDIRYQADMRLGAQIEERINNITNGVKKPVAFVGIKNVTLNASCIQGDLIGKSIFSWDSEAEPHYLISSERIVNLLRTMGFDFDNVTNDEMIEARKIAIDMPIWPANDSICDVGEFIIVKLSEDNWYTDDIMDTTVEKVEFNKLEFSNDKLRWAIDDIVIDNNFITIRGWVHKPNVSSNDSKVTVYLKNVENNTILKLNTLVNIREDLNNAFKNESDYSKSGYVAKIKISNLEGSLNSNTIILKYENDNEELFVDTQKFIISN